MTSTIDGSDPPHPGRPDGSAAGPPVATGSIRSRPLPIGQCLIEAKYLQAGELSAALKRQTGTGVRLGEELIGRGTVRPFDFYRTLARQSGLPFVNLLTEPPEARLLETADLDFYLRSQILPWRHHEGTRAFAAVNTQAAASLLKEKTAAPFALYQTSPVDILRTAQAAFSSDLTKAARETLLASDPSASAHRLFSPTGRVLLCAAPLGVAATAFAFPVSAFLLLNAVTAIAFVALALLRLLSIRVARRRSRSAVAIQTSRPDRDLPLYTILVPLLREAAVLPILVDALRRLDYPPSKLDIKLVLEETDTETIDAARQLKLPGTFELILVPSSHPTTKPKACNYALRFARGEFLVVYDAEDIPGPGQLREAVAAFDRGGARLACVQAPLAYYNWDENWLTRHFAIEYAAIFDLLLPTLARLGQPFPLGGTSTHFRTSILRKVGAWDAYNVTEDADLGIRLHEAGYLTGMLTTPTLEEANCQLPNWTRQRSRWLKGWMQTYIVRMRQPYRTLERLGLAGFTSFQIVIGAFLLSALAHPLFYAAALYAFLFGMEAPTSLGPALLGFFNLAVLLLGFSAAILAGLAGASARGLRGLGAHALTMPLYWLLISFSAYKALVQLVSRPHYWEKTLHGVSAMAPAYLARARAREQGLSRRKSADSGA